MQQHMVRAVVTTKYGCQERSPWYPEGSPEAAAAAESLVLKRTGDFRVDWEEWDEVYLKRYRQEHRKIIGRSFCQTSSPRNPESRDLAEEEILSILSK